MKDDLTLDQLKAQRERRKQIRQNNRGVSSRKLSAKAQGEGMRAKVLSRLIENRTLDKGWRKEAMGENPDLLKQRKQAKTQIAKGNPRGATALTGLKPQLQAYRQARKAALHAAAPQDRSAIASGKVRPTGPAGGRPVAGGNRVHPIHRPKKKKNWAWY